MKYDIVSPLVGISVRVVRALVTGSLSLFVFVIIVVLYFHLDFHYTRDMIGIYSVAHV
jgi:hypothetical protein